LRVAHSVNPEPPFAVNGTIVCPHTLVLSVFFLFFGPERLDHSGFIAVLLPYPDAIFASKYKAIVRRFKIRSDT
jgi:hypothetical protein